MDSRIRATVEHILRLLVAGDYEGAATLTAGIRLSAQEMCDAIQQYGRTLVLGPSVQLDAIDAIEVENANPKRWSVNVPLWTEEEGRSDLTLELTLIDRGAMLGAELDDIHVL